MRFSKVVLVLVLFVQTLFAANPLGIVIRPNLVRKVIEELNRRHDQNERISLKFCFGDANIGRHYLKVDFSAEWGEAHWPPGEHEVFFEALVRNFDAEGAYVAGCTIHPVTGEVTPGNAKPWHVSLKIQKGRIGLHLDPQTMLIRAEPTFFKEASSTMQVSLFLSGDEKTLIGDEKKNEAKELSDFLNSPTLRVALLQGLLDYTTAGVSEFLKEKLRGFVFLQSAGEALKDNPIWKAGKLVEKGAFTLELAERNPKANYLTFDFNPFQQQSAFSSVHGLEIYFYGGFLDFQSLSDLLGFDVRTRSPSEILRMAKEKKNDPSHWSKEAFTRPTILDSTSDLSFVIPGSLPNETFAQLYQAQLLHLKLKANLGSQTKGLIAKEAQDTYSIVTINPHSAPQMVYEPDKFKFVVKNYVMDFKTAIEDLLIPTTQIQTDVSISASLKVDSKNRMVKMALDPSQFELKLKDLRERFTKDEMLLYQKITTTIWKDFFTNYAEFEIFPTVIDTGSVPLEIQNVIVKGDSIILDANLLLRGATL